MATIKLYLLTFIFFQSGFRGQVLTNKLLTFDEVTSTGSSIIAVVPATFGVLDEAESCSDTVGSVWKDAVVLVGDMGPLLFSLDAIC